MEVYSRVTMSDDDSLFRYRRDSSDELPGRHKTNSFPSTKKVKFVKNGDKFFGGVQFTISPQRHRNLDALLSELTEIISLPYGVRSILTPQGGRRIDTIDQLENGKTYVCSSKHGLTKIDYKNVKSPSNWSAATRPVKQDKLARHTYHPLQRTHTGDSIASVKSVASSTASLPSPKVITVVRNGPPPREKNKVLVNQQTTPSWEYLLQSIIQLFDSKSNPVKKLFMMNGIEVQSMSQLLHGGDLFIAVGSEPFNIDEFVTGVVRNNKPHHRRRRKLSASTLTSVDSMDAEADNNGVMKSPVNSRVIVNGTDARDFANQSLNHSKPSKTVRFPLEHTTIHSTHNAPQTSNRIPDHSRQLSEEESSSTSQLGRRPRGFSLDSEELSKSTESDETSMISGFGTVNSRLRNFISTSSMKSDQYYGYPVPVPDTPNSSNMSIGGTQTIEMLPRVPLEYYQPDKDTRTVGIQADSAENQQTESVLDNSSHRSNSNAFMRKVEDAYDRGSILGEGRFAVAWSGVHKTSRKEVALKMISRAKVFGREDIVENELRIMKSVNHPNIIKLIEDFESDNDITLVMELVQGGDLFDAIVHCHHFTEATCKRITRDLGHALLYLHGKKIVHRDIKPENLFIAVNADGSHNLKLGDFGLATVFTEPLSLLCGTPSYCAPEMLLEIGYGVKVDIWASGVICYILLCGYPPFGSQRSSKAVIYKNIKKGEYSFFSPFWDSISPEAKNFVSLLLQYSPNNRCSAEEMLRHPWLRDGDNMVDRFCGNNNDNLARQFHDHIQSRSRAKTTTVPVLSIIALDKGVHQLYH